MIEEQEVVTFFTGKGWTKEDIHKCKKHLLAELNLFTAATNITIEEFYIEFMSKCDADEYNRHCKHIFRHMEFTQQFIKDLIQAHERTNFYMFIMILLFVGYSFFLN